MSQLHRRRFVAGAFAVLLVTSCSSDFGSSSPTPKTRTEEALEKLDGIAQGLLDKTGVPGMAVAVVKDDEVVYAKGFGVREIGQDARIEPETVFQMASLSKPVGASAIAAAVGEGKIAWSDPITKYLPDFALSDAAVTPAVTIADMYAHQSGLPLGAGDILEVIGWDRAEIIHRLRLVPLTPDGFRKAWAYSNFGMTIGAEAAAKGAGTSWEDLTRTRIFEPLGMASTSSRFADFGTRPNRATIHKKLNGAWVRSPFIPRNPDAQSAAGGITSNVVDLAKWMRMMLASGKFEGKQIVAQAALEDMETGRLENAPATATDAASQYGLGIYRTEDSGGRVRLSHSGIFDAGVSTTCALVPSEHLGIVVLTNGEPVGLPEAVAATFLDHALDGTSTRDWLAHFYDEHGPKPAPDWMGGPKPSAPAPAREDSAYIGKYESEYYGGAEVKTAESGTGLVLVLGPQQYTFPLSAWDGDKMALEHVREFEMTGTRSPVTFAVGQSGPSPSLVLGILGDPKLATFTRR